MGQPPNKLSGLLCYMHEYVTCIHFIVFLVIHMCEDLVWALAAMVQKIVYQIVMLKMVSPSVTIARLFSYGAIELWVSC